MKTRSAVDFLVFLLLSSRQIFAYNIYCNDLQCPNEYWTNVADEVDPMLTNPHTVLWGDSSYLISRGGGDMYDNGNYLRWNGGTSLKYKYSEFQNADNRNGPYIGDYVYNGTSYPGLGNTYKTFIRTSSMMLIATVESQGTFSVTGNLGADGAGNLNVGEYSSSRWRGFRKSVYGAGTDASVNHLIMVSDPGRNTGVTRTYGFDTDLDDHSVENIQSETTLIYLMYATASSGMSLEEHRALFDRIDELTTPCSIANVNELRTHVDEWITGNLTQCNDTIELWDVSGLTDLSYVFCARPGDSRCNTIRSDFNADISTWNVNQVTSLESTFDGAESMFGQGLEKWNVESVVNFNNTFMGCCTSMLNCVMIDIDTSWSAQNTAFREAYPDWYTLDCEICQEKEHVQNETCVSCSPGTTNMAGDLVPGPETSCDPILCGEGEHVVNHTCMTCPSGSSRVAGDDASGQDTICDCVEDYHVINHTCVACSPGQSNLQGDDPSGPDTSCATCRITTKEELMDYVDQWIENSTNHPCGEVIGDWEVGRITDMSYVFCAYDYSECNSNRVTFNADISHWNTASVTSLDRTFYKAVSLTGEGVSNWNTSSVTSLSYTFFGATSFNGNLSNWDTSKVTTLSYTFSGANSLMGDGLSNWDTSRVTDLSGTFYGATSFTGDAVSNWNTSSVTSLSYTFSDSTSLTGDGLSNWDTSRVTNLQYAFRDTTSFTGDGVSNWDTSKVTDLSGTFYGATSFAGYGVSNWDTSRVTTLERTFYSATAFNGDLSNWDTSSVTSLYQTFYLANSFTGDSLLNWDTLRVTNLYETFRSCSSFKGMVWRWNVERVTIFQNTFYITPEFRSCFKRFVYDLWSVQIENVPHEEWPSVSECTFSLSEALEIEPCFGTPCTCRSMDLNNLRCFNCGTIPTSLGTCTNLTSFSVAETYGTLHGTIPTELGRLVKLTHLDLSGNALEGPIPEHLFNVSNLQSLDLHRNNLNGTLSNRINDLSNLESLVLQHNKLSGEIPESIGSCSKLIRLNLSDNEFRGELPSTLPSSLQEIRVDRNNINGSLPLDTIRNLTNLREFHADRNRLEGEVDDAFSNTTNLERINLGHNKFSGSVPVLRDLIHLTEIILRDNEFDSVQTESFAGDSSLTILDLSHQRSQGLTLLDYAFALASSHIKLILTGNNVPVISSYAFDGLNNVPLDLTDLTIHELAPHAFAGTYDLQQLDLRGNYITIVDPTSFPPGVAHGAQCVDTFGWETRCAELAVVNNDEKCFRRDSCEDLTLLETEEDESINALSACCIYGGGFRAGTRLLMENASPIRCEPVSETSDIIKCECSNEMQRYDIHESQCVSSCASGERWEVVDSQEHIYINSTIGTCVSCLVGTYSIAAADWVDVCEECSQGKFVGTNGSSTCLECAPGRFAARNKSIECETCPLGTQQLSSGESSCKPLPAGQFGSGTPCPSNSYSKSGAAKCTDCPSGKYSDTAASQCIECDFMYRLSKHCEFPVAGMLLILSSILVVVVAFLLFRRYKKKQDRIKQQLRLDLYRQKQLVKTKQTDIRLMTGAWKLSPKEVKLEEKIAIGAYGEVWKGALHNRWIVAIKKLFPSSTSSSSSASSSNSRSISSKRRKNLVNELFKNDEIRFLIRTRHERLVMFLGCGIDNNAGCFLVTEFMDGGSLDRALWSGGSSAISTSWMQRIQILLDVVDGLLYLHLVHKSVHLDLKSPNILLEKIVSNDDDAARTDRSVTHRAKIADFGLSRIFNKGKQRLQPTKATQKSSKTAARSANWVTMSKRKGFVGTPRWMAPEMMKKEVKFGPSADVYSFGVVMWEVWSGRKPWSEFSDKQEIFKAVKEDKRRLKSPIETERIEGYEELVRSCTEYKANHRPLIDSVRSDLQVILERAAEVESNRKKTTDLELSHHHQEDFDDDTKKTSSHRDRRVGFEENSSSSNSSSSVVHIEMGVIAATSS